MFAKIAMVFSIFIGFSACPFAIARMSLSHDYIGQVLLFPYYSADAGMDTALSLMNHSPAPKIVRMRFRESQNARTVFQFNLFLSPNHVWVGVITRDAKTGGAKLVSRDRSCSSPPLNSQGQAFSTALFTEMDERGIIIDASAERTLQGYIEVIELGNITSKTVQSAIQIVNGKPNDCLAASVALYSDDLLEVRNKAELALSPPEGAISGTGTLIHVAEGNSYNYNAAAVAGAFDTAQHFAPFSAKPAIEDVSKEIAFFDQSSRWEASFARGIDAFSALFMRDMVFGEWTNEPEVNSDTDIVTTFPTKYAYTFNCGTAAQLPFISKGFCKDRGVEEIFQGIVDREERTFLRNIECDPFPCSPPKYLRGASAVSSFAGGIDNRNDWSPTRYDLVSRPPIGSLVLKDAFATRLRPPVGNRGWLAFEFTSKDVQKLYSLPGAKRNGESCGTLALRGLPVLGFYAQKFVNGNVNGVASDYGIANSLAYERRVACSPS
jgi:hypothetical protein